VETFVTVNVPAGKVKMSLNAAVLVGDQFVPTAQSVLDVPVQVYGDGLTVIVPVAVTVLQPLGVNVTVKLPPALVGVPLMVTTFAAQIAVNPLGSPLNVAPVAPVVVYVIVVMALPPLMI
jgi:hypothetical protein